MEEKGFTNVALQKMTAQEWHCDPHAKSAPAGELHVLLTVDGADHSLGLSSSKYMQSLAQSYRVWEEGSAAVLQLHAWGEHDDISEPCSTFGCAMPESPPQQSPLLAFAPQLAGVHQFRDQQLGFHILSMNHTKPCSATQHCSFDSTLAWAVTSTALLACVLTLLAVWLLRKRLLPPPLVQVVCLDKVQGVCTATVREQHADKQCVNAPGSDRM
jgi:hypothetical protein